ncbi:hypothetical protein P4O66_008062, partial [Electrophorus voltai]
MGGATAKGGRVGGNGKSHSEGREGSVKPGGCESKPGHFNQRLCQTVAQFPPVACWPTVLVAVVVNPGHPHTAFILRTA